MFTIFPDYLTKTCESVRVGCHCNISIDYIDMMVKVYLDTNTEYFRLYQYGHMVTPPSRDRICISHLCKKHPDIYTIFEVYTFIKPSFKTIYI